MPRGKERGKVGAKDFFKSSWPLGPISFFLIKKKESRACEPMNTAKNNKQQMNNIKAA
jgi:hypothetical protein